MKTAIRYRPAPIIYSITIHLGRNPKNGGSPPIDSIFKDTKKFVREWGSEDMFSWGRLPRLFRLKKFIMIRVINL